MFNKPPTQQELNREMDRLLSLERQCNKTMAKNNVPKEQRELLDVLDSLGRQKKQLSEDMI